MFSTQLLPPVAVTVEEVGAMFPQIREAQEAPAVAEVSREVAHLRIQIVFLDRVSAVAILPEQDPPVEVGAEPQRLETLMEQASAVTVLRHPSLDLLSLALAVAVGPETPTLTEEMEAEEPAPSVAVTPPEQ